MMSKRFGDEDPDTYTPEPDLKETPMTLTREQVTVQLYGGEDYRIYDGTRLVATVYHEEDLAWLLDRDAGLRERPTTDPRERNPDMALTREQVEHICKHGIEDGHLFTRIGAAHSILAHDAALRARIATYQARLEIDHEYNAAGERAEIPEAERDARIDGISCRDETIRLQDHAIDELKARIEALEQELVDNKIILTEERQINADNRRQIRGLQQREVELRHELEMKRQERDLAMNARDSFLQQLAAIRAELALFQGIFGEHDATPRAIDQARALWDGLTQQLAVQRDHLEEQQREYVKCAETIQLLKEQLCAKKYHA